jgi:hypothetical protein
MPVLPQGSARTRFVLFAGLVAAATAFPVACSSGNSGAPPTGSQDAAVDAAQTTTPDAGSADSMTDAATLPTGNVAVARFVLGAGTTPPNFLDVPFPTDAYLQNGSILAQIPGIETMIPEDTNYIEYGLSQQNGFSRLALSFFAVDVPGADAGLFSVASAQIDPTTLPVAETDCTKPTSSVYVVDLAANAATPILPCRAAFHDDRPRSQTNPVISVGTPRGYLLQEGHQYAIVLTSRVKDTSGRAITASADFAAVAAGTAPGTIGAAYVSAYKAASTVLASSLAGDHATIVSMSAFTTTKRSKELFALRDALESAPAPTLSWDADAMAPMSNARFAAATATDDGGASDGGTTLPPGFTASLDDWLGVVPASAKLPSGIDDPDLDLAARAHDQIAAVGNAVFSATSYLQVKPTTYADPTHATFAYNDAGVPVAQANVPIWVTVVTPKAAMPATGYPTVIVQHGLSASRDFILALANTFAAKGWMVVGIDSVTFGARAAEPALQIDHVSNYGGAGTTATYNGPDGFADEPTNGSSDLFGGLQSVLAIRDQFRQAGFDTAQLVKVLRSPALDLSPLTTGSVAPKVDPSKIAYVGDSLGAMEGTIAAAIEPNVAAWFMNVNAGSLFPDLTSHSPAIGALLVEAAGFNFGINGDVFTWSHPLLQVLQNIVDPGDPITYAEFLTANPQPLAGTATSRRNGIQTEVIWDYMVTDEANEAMARALGWSLATPNVGSNADITDLSEVTANTSNDPRATPLVVVDPDDAGTFHDTPFAGTTNLVIQVGPAQHGTDLVASQGELDFTIPFAPPYTKLTTPVTFPEDYRGLQNVAVTFFDDAFNGRVPRVFGPSTGQGFSAPVRIVSIDGGQ